MNQPQLPLTSASLYPVVDRFESASIILPVINEVASLEETVETVLRQVGRVDLREFVVVVCEKTTRDSMAMVEKLRTNMEGLVVVIHQKLPFLGGALQAGFEVARGSHVVMMASDLETNPGEVAQLIAESKKNPMAVVSTSRWLRGDAFHGYSRIKLVCNWIFQRMFSLLYQTCLTDMTFGFRILPTELVRAIRWDELRHPFCLESILKPLRLGVPVSEIPTTWKARVEGESQNSFFRNFEYFRTGIKVRFSRRTSFLRRVSKAHEQTASIREAL